MNIAHKLTAPDEQAWIAACLAGDRNAFRPLVERYQAAVFRIAWRLLADRTSAEDVTQDTFVKAYAALARFDGKRAFSTWLYRIAVNTCLDRRRRKQEQLDGELDGTTAPAGSQRLEREEVERAVQACLQRLAPDYRVAVVLKDIEGMDYEAMAEVLGDTVTALKIRVVRGRAKLATILRKLYPDLVPPV